jgi:hypothetical protein
MTKYIANIEPLNEEKIGTKAHGRNCIILCVRMNSSLN